MAAAAGTIKSTLNPNAPLFVPAAFQQVEDFSPEWWELVKTTSWFRDYWFHEHQQQEEISTIHHHVEGDDDLAFLLPDSLDLGILEDEEQEEEPRPQLESNKLSSGLEFEGERLIRSLSLRLTKNVGIRHSSKQWEKPAQTFSPRSGERRVIQQPR